MRYACGGAIIVNVSLWEEVFEVVSESGLQITLSRADCGE